MSKKKVCKKDSSTESGAGETLASSEYESPFVKKFGETFGEDILPNIENDYSRAKAYLMRQYLSSGDNLWDHLNEVLKKILIERPKDIACNFEEFSYKMKETRYRDKSDYLMDVFVPPVHYETARRTLELLHPVPEENAYDKMDVEEDMRFSPNSLETFFYFEQGGVGLPKEEIICIAMHLRKLHTEFSVEKYRFWGKILGIHKNYYIAETDLNEDELGKLNMEKEEEDEKLKLEQSEKEALEQEEAKAKREAELEEAKEKERQFAIERSDFMYNQMVKDAKMKQLSVKPERKEMEPWPPVPPLPLAYGKRVTPVPSEPTGVGVNKKVYYVCNYPGEKWIQLPNVTPAQIVAARKIKRAFTGDLSSEMRTYPAFPGKEGNYLRAQIARISAATQISPLGYYTFNEEDEEEEAEQEILDKNHYAVNPDFEPVAMRDLLDPSMAFWVHHTPYILGQGRTTWWNPAGKEEVNEEEGEAEEEEEVPKEIGPELLTPLSEDSTMDAIVPWSVRRTSTLFPEHSVALVRSNIWPGAYAFAVDKKFDNVYVGYGLKFSANNHSPEPMGDIQVEYLNGPEIMEISDPTPEEEEAWERRIQKKKDEEEEEEEANVTSTNVDDDADDEDDEE